MTVNMEDITQNILEIILDMDMHNSRRHRSGFGAHNSVYNAQISNEYGLYAEHRYPSYKYQSDYVYVAHGSEARNSGSIQ